jgi:2-isopropylmalate synthase
MDACSYGSSARPDHLTNYRVRIPTLAPRPVTRVLIESEDENGEHWTTIRVSHDIIDASFQIIDASFQALMDSIVYKLVKSEAPA